MTKIKIDSVDLRILSAIQQNGIVSKIKLAELVNLSPTPCWARVSRLKAAGVIKGTRGFIELQKLGDYFHVIVTVSLRHHRKSDFERFENFVGKVDAVINCFSTGGGTDYIMEFVTPNMLSFQGLMESMLDADLEIDRYMTFIVTKRIKSSPANLNELFKK